MHILIALFIGAMSGVVAALCGVGGGVVMVPAFVLLLKLSQKAAVATSLAAMILTAISASVKNYQNAIAIDWTVALAAGLAGAAVAYYAADWLKSLQDVTLTRIFATLIIVFGVQMWIQSAYKKNLSSPEKPPIASNHKKN